MQELKITNIERINIKPNDCLLVSSPTETTEKWRQETRQTLLQTIKGLKPRQIIFCSDKIKVQVISQQQAMLIKLEQSK